VSEQVTRIAGLLREAAKLHHDVYRITDGADDDWASWYADWLTSLSELPEILGMKLVRSEVTWLLVKLEGDYAAAGTDEQWEDFYARAFVDHFAKE
jgi:hypothetical protein